MKKLLLLAVVLYLILPSAYSQYLVAVGGGDPETNAGKRDTIAQCDIQVKYELKFIPDTTKRDKHKTQTMVLRMNTKGVSVYQEYGKYRSDSVSAARTRNGKIRLSDTNEAIKYQTKARDNITIAKSWPENDQLLVREQIGLDGTFTYTEKKPDFSWNVDFSQTKDIAGYTCHSAQGNYAGRDYQAWFTADIPISDGPWFFCGLPGLILEVSSLDEEFVYTCMSIQKGTGPITLRSLDDAFKTDREKFLKAKRKNKEASSAEIMKAFGDKIQSSTISTNNGKRVYNPQEKY